MELSIDNCRVSTEDFSVRLMPMWCAICAMAIQTVVSAGTGLQVNPGNPTFEVASIKRNTSGDGRVFIRNQAGRFVATNVTLKLLIRNAYRLQDFQISGGPSWLSADHFDIVAKVDSGVEQTPFTPDQSAPSTVQLMIRALLADRFKLVVHTEKKDLPIYALVVARKDGRLGAELHKSEIDCGALAAAPGRSSQPPPTPGGLPQCGVRIGIGNMSVNGGTLAQLANSLAMFVGRTVVDKTELTGAFDFNLTWTPDQMPNVQAGPPPPNAPPPPPADAPSIYTALQEQLGLKLDSTRGPVEILVIDRADHPTEN
jgi:uncharacterized protein (TIGR03435 family)